MTREPHEDIVVECDLPEAPEKVWRALTEPEIVAAWLMPNDIKAETGHRFSLGTEGGIDCTVLEAEPGRLLRYSWHERDAGSKGTSGFDSVVTFELARTANGGTHLRVVHDGFIAATTATCSISGANCSVAINAPRPNRTLASANAPQWRMAA
ncbi:SRPBCC domain-containing protein [Mesorhizobium sp. 1M-11]|uniref:SRPBCC family protein n=1 Tax=Mesorhizobium sp. 1M-11 TaxID=1529006 RepID=UPI0006C74D39|nr:SRPBCC domain-containing protein [Mesorhizobium sp. 1M-11]